MLICNRKQDIFHASKAITLTAQFRILHLGWVHRSPSQPHYTRLRRGGSSSGTQPMVHLSQAHPFVGCWQSGEPCASFFEPAPCVVTFIPTPCSTVTKPSLVSRLKEVAGQFPARGKSPDALFSLILPPASHQCYFPYLNTWSTSGCHPVLSAHNFPKHRTNVPHFVLPLSDVSLALNGVFSAYHNPLHPKGMAWAPPPLRSLYLFFWTCGTKCLQYPLASWHHLYCALTFRIFVLFPQLHCKHLKGRGNMLFQKVCCPMHIKGFSKYWVKEGRR